MFPDIFYIITSQNISLCNNNDQTCFSDTLTSTEHLWLGFNIFLGAQQMLMHRKSCLIPIVKRNFSPLINKTSLMMLLQNVMGYIFIICIFNALVDYPI